MGVVVSAIMNEAQDAEDAAVPAAAATENFLAASDTSNASAAENPQLRRQFAYSKKRLMAEKA